MHDLVLTRAQLREPRVDSQQFTVDTDLMELAYRDEPGGDADPDATVRLEMQDEPAPADARPEARDDVESDPLADTLLDCERVDDSNVVALWDPLEEEEDGAPTTTRVRVSGKA